MPLTTCRFMSVIFLIVDDPLTIVVQFKFCIAHVAYEVISTSLLATDDQHPAQKLRPGLGGGNIRDVFAFKTQ